jgi:polysaccharide chain length determinant protein (PEP-CTERM system associated)
MSMSETETPALYDPPTEPLSVLIQEFLCKIVRRKWVVLGSIVAGVAIAAILCVVLPKSYRSNTLILIENQKIPEDYVKGIGGASIEQRLTMIQQQVMSRTFLSKVLDEYNLYEGQVRREGLESAIETLRKMIKVETLGTSGSWGKSVEALSISFAHEDPMTAMKVTAKLSSLFVEENFRVREQLVTGVSDFLEQELHDAKKLLEEKERVISDFKTRYVTELPEQKEANLRTLDRLQTELNTTIETIHSLTARQSLFEKAVAQYEQYEMKDTTASQPMSRMRNQPIQDPLVIRLSELQKQLATLMATYKDTYPDIISLKEEIKELQAQMAERAQIAKKKLSQSEESQPDPSERPGRVFDPQLQKLLAQMDESRLDITNFKVKEIRIIREMKEIEGRVERTPSREQQLMILVRDYDNMQKNYQALLDKRLNAHVAENLEKRQQGEQIRVLDPANLPQKPEKPNRLIVMILGLLGGGGLGVGLAIGLDQVNPTFKRREEVETLWGIRLLGIVPNFFTMYPRLQAQEQANRSNGYGLSRSSTERRSRPYPWWFTSANPEVPFTPHLNLVTKWQPGSIAVEPYRMIATKVVLSTSEGGSTIITVSSALKGEGKTTTVVNLGYTLARDLGKRTLLIDCDFRCPALHQYVTVPARAGLIQLLDGEAGLEDCLSTIDEVPCSIISVGGWSDDHKELTRIQQLSALLPKLRVQFDFVILNCAPILPSATMGILASLADVLILVIRSGITPKRAVQQALTMLGQTSEVCVVLNGVEHQTMPYYMSEYTGSYGRGASYEQAPR